MTIEELKKEYECKINLLNKEFNDKIAKLQKAEKESNKKWWKPEIGENYYYISGTGEVLCGIYKYDYIDACISEQHYVFHNMFKTAEEAEFAAKRWMVIRELEMLADDIVWSEELCGDIIFTYAIRYCEDIFGKSLYGNVFYFDRTQPFYFKSKESVQKAIEIIGEDRLKKYWLGINEESDNKSEDKSDEDEETIN